MLGLLFLDFLFLPTNGTWEGIILTWQRTSIALSNPIMGTHHIKALIYPLVENHHWCIIGDYGPQEDKSKIYFLSEL